MAEVPPHLLERSRSRRVALGLSSGDAEASAPAASSAPAAPAAGTALAVASDAPAPDAAPRGKAAVAVELPPPPEPRKPHIPMWMLPVVVALPVWIFGYIGVFVEQKSKTVTPVQMGASVYAANCASCHLSNGAGKDGGGIGRPLWNGEAEKTFPKLEAQIAFVRNGSCAVGAAYGNPNREGAQHVALGGMPAFTALSADEITNVVLYERTVLSGLEFPEADPAAAPTTTVPLDPKSACPS